VVALTLSPSAATDESSARIARSTETFLEEVLAGEQDRWRTVDPRLGEIVEHLAVFVLSGGKRLRPVFCTWGYVAAGGRADDASVESAAGALELLHAFALLHDDVMDGSDTRRSNPALHRRLAADHAAAGWRGESRRFGEGMAVLAGDLAFAYADRLMTAAPLAARAVWDELRIELTMGQFLDVAGAASGHLDLRTSRCIASYKSGRYTVERPLHLGAALAGRLDQLGPHFTAYGQPLGEAFQLRDDLLGAFGDTATLGKPVGDDFREGKPTVLLALAEDLATREQRSVLGRVGRPDLTTCDIDAIRDVLVSSGAAGAVERLIDDQLDRALAAVDAAPIPAEARDALAALAVSAVRRDR
jgi:geranylgeranyl diphosphate synthase type I